MPNDNKDPDETKDIDEWTENDWLDFWAGYYGIGDD